MPAGRFQIAFTAPGDPVLDWDATFTDIDDTDSLVASYTIDRGRQYELDQTDTGRATVEIIDREGLLDPTNPTLHYGQPIEPLLQAKIRRYNPVTEEWHTRFRGFIEELDYTFHPSQQVNVLTVQLVDMFEVVSRVEMLPDLFGDTPSLSQTANVVFNSENVDDRITRILQFAFIPEDFFVIFSGNVVLYQTVYSPGESAMSAIQEAADAEWPGVGNVYADRLGRLCFHGRLSKFDPVGVHSGATPGAWEFNQWKAGDSTAVTASPSDTAQIRRFAFNRGLAKIINQATATPLEDRIDAEDIPGQEVHDVDSRLQFGMRSWSAHNLLTKRSLLDDSNSLVETKRFAQFYVDNFKQPHNRVTDIAFRTMRPGTTGAPVTWHLLTEIDISDTVEVTIDSPGGGGFTSEDYFVEGIHETSRPLNPDYDDVDLTLDLSPRSYFITNPWGDT